MGICISSNAQSYAYKQYTINDGLPSNHVYHVVEDAMGYIWAATDQGLARYDGYEWVTYGVKDSLRCTDCWNLQQTSPGTYLVSGNTTEANLLHNGMLHPVSLQELDSSKHDEPVYQTALSVTYPAGITFLTEDSIYFVTVAELPEYPENTPRFRLQTIGSRSLRYRWQMRAFFALHHGMDHSDTATIDAFRRFSDNRPESIRSNFFFVTQGPLKGDYYIVDDVLERCQLNECKQLVALRPADQSGPVNWQASADGHTLHVSFKNRLIVIDSTGRILVDQSMEDLPQEVASSVGYRDLEGNQWFSTSNAGLFCFPANRARLRIYGQPGSVRAIASSRLGLLVARERGLEYLNAGKLTPFPDAPTSLNQSPITYLNTARNGSEVFVASFDAGLRIDSTGFTDIADHVGMAAFRYSRTTRSIYQYNRGTLGGIQYGLHTSADGYSTWTVGNQVIIADPQNGHFELDPGLDWRMAPPPADKDVAFVFGKHELYQCDIGTCVPLLVDFEPTITSVKPLVGGLFLIGTASDGVYTYNAKLREPPLVFYPLNDVHAIAKSTDTLWFVSPTGLIASSIQGRHVASWNAGTGLPADQCTDVAIWKDSVAVVSGGQLVLFKRSAPKPLGRGIKSRLHVTQIEAGGVQLSHNLTGRVSPRQASIVLRPDQRDLTVDFSLVRPTLEGKVAYSIQLEPFDKTPRIQQERKVSYTNLSPGIYTLQISANTPDGAEYQLASPIRFQLLPAWHERWFVQGLFLLAFLAAVVSLIRMFEDRRRKEFLRKQDAIRKTGELRLEALRSQMNPHFVFNALGSIQYYIQNESKELADEYLGRFAKLMRRYLDSSKQSFSTVAEELQLVSQYIELEQVRYDKSFTYTIDADAAFAEENLIPSMIVQPFVENAILHGLAMRKDGNAALHIAAALKDGALSVQIEDNGQGRANADRKRRRGHKSQATLIIKERIEALQRSEMAIVKVEYSDLYPEDSDFPGTKVMLTIELFAEE